jgi:NADH-quinone oxidoreductase subunit F
MPLIWRVLDQRPVRSLREYVEMGGGNAARLARQASPEEVVELLCTSGLRGRGGAGFPTGPKWRTVAASRSKRDVTTVVVNAAEGEPGTFKDRALLRTNPYRVLEGAMIAATTMRSDQICIGIKGTFAQEISRLTSAISEMREAGWLDDLDVQFVLGPSSYLFGEETALLEVIEGRQPFPRVTPPYRRGVQVGSTRSAGRVNLATSGGNEAPPALVDNVETLANVPLIVDLGAEWFRELGSERSPGTVICTVTGATRRSAVGEVAMGSTLREVIDLIGWGPRPGHSVQIVIAGTANAFISSDLLDTPLTYEAMKDAGSGLGSAGFIVFDERTEPASVAAGVARFLSIESCGQCEHCKGDGLDIAERLRRSLGEEFTSADITTMRQQAASVAIGARCNLAQQQATVTESLLALFPTSLGSRPHAAIGPIEPVTIAPIEELAGGRAILDARQLNKQPDWSYGDKDSGATPAARLGNTPVHVVAERRTSPWPEWTPSGSSTGDPLDIIDVAHEAIDALIDRAMADDEVDLDGRIDDLVAAVRTHVDVTRRVLFPMVRRVDDDIGERLADAAEAQERTLLLLTSEIDRTDARRWLQDIGAAMHHHAAIGDELLALLRAELDPVERSRLADGLAAAQRTSTVSRLSRNGPGVSVPVPSPSPALRERPPRYEKVEQMDARPQQPEEDTPVVDRGGRAEEGRSAGTSTPVIVTRPARHATSPLTHNRTALQRILVGVDGSSAARAALEWADQLAGLVGSEVVLTNVFEPDRAELPPDEFEKLLDEAERRLTNEWAASLRASNIPHRCLQLTGAPDALLAACDAENADLLVVGTRGPGRHAWLHLGSLAHHLAHYTRGPLAIVPVTGATRSIDRIIVAVDGSPGGAAAVNWCASVAAASGAEVTAICCVEPRRWGIGGRDGDWKTSAEKAIGDAWTAPLRAGSVVVRTRISKDRHPLAALERAATDEDAGIFVVGTSPLSESTGMRLGRLPLQLVHHTHVPVVLIPPPPTPDKPRGPDHRLKPDGPIQPQNSTEGAA